MHELHDRKERLHILVDASLNVYAQMHLTRAVASKINYNLEVQLSPYLWVEGGEA